MKSHSLSLLLLYIFTSCTLEPFPSAESIYTVSVADQLPAKNIVSTCVIEVIDAESFGNATKSFKLSWSGTTTKFLNGSNEITVTYGGEQLAVPFYSTAAGNASLTVTPNEVSSLNQISFVEFFNPIADDLFSTELSATSLPADNQSELTLQITAGNTTIDPTKKISFATTKGRFLTGSTSSERPFDANGQCFEKLKSSEPGLAVITITYDDLAVVREFQFTAPDASTLLQLQPASTNIVADGIASVQVQALVNPPFIVAGQTVNYASSLGSWQGTNASSTTTALPNAIGQATALLRSTSPGVASITASYSNQVASASVNFIESRPDYLSVVSVDQVANSPLKKMTISLLRSNGGTCSNGLAVSFGADNSDILFTNTTLSQTLNNQVQVETSLWHPDNNFADTIIVTATTLNQLNQLISVQYPVVIE